VTDLPDSVLLDEARQRLGLSVRDLWIRYFAIGGGVDQMEFEGFLHGMIKIDRFQYNVLAHAINEAFMDAGSTERVPYIDESMGC
jgi:hypothetical protein